MTTLLLIPIYKVAMAVTCLIVILLFMFSAAYAGAWFHAIKFKADYNDLKDMLDKAPVNIDNYHALNDMFNDLSCNSENEEILKKQLWNCFEAKYHKIMPPENIIKPMGKEAVNKKLHSAYGKFRSVV